MGSTLYKDLSKIFSLNLSKITSNANRNETLTVQDYEELAETMKRAYPQMSESIWSKKSIEKLTRIFPDGQICITVDGKLAAVALSIIVNYEEFGDDHTYSDITGNYTFNTHSSTGNVLYGIEVFVDPEFRELRLGRRLYDARKELCELLNLKSIILGGRIRIIINTVTNFPPEIISEKSETRKSMILYCLSSFPIIFCR